MTSPVCKRYDTCNAPLCPLDERSLSHGMWYPDDEICPMRAYAALPWIRKQRKLVNQAASPDRYFTLRMLARNCIIRKGIEGLDPNQSEEEQLTRWLKAHPEKRSLSEKERERVAQRLTGARGLPAFGGARGDQGSVT
jgi:hypothetical protein